jgi:hypothetical protein
MMVNHLRRLFDGELLDLEVGDARRGDVALAAADGIGDRLAAGEQGWRRDRRIRPIPLQLPAS